MSPLGVGRTALATVAILLGLSSAALAAPPRTQQGAVIVKTAIARARPGVRAHALERVWSYTPFSSRHPVLPVLGAATDQAGARWLHVRLPSRPNGATGWMPASRTKSLRLRWRVVVDLSKRTAAAYHSGDLQHTFSVVVGKPSTPTPTGHFFVIDHVRLDTWWAPGTRALMLSAYAPGFQVTPADPGEIALHSRGILTDPLGSAASHGCIRFAQRDIDWLVARLPAGTPVDVRR